MDWLDLILCCPLLLTISNNPSIRVFSSEFVLHIRWPEYFSVSFHISPSNEYSGLISFRICRLALLAVQESSPTPQFKSMNSFTFSLLYRPTHIHTWLLEKPQPWLDGPCWQSTISVFNRLSRLVITFLPKSKCLLISWLQSPSAVILEDKKKKKKFSHCFTIYLPWSDGTRCHDLVFWILSFKPTFFTLLFHFH